MTERIELVSIRASTAPSNITFSIWDSLLDLLKQFLSKPVESTPPPPPVEPVPSSVRRVMVYIHGAGNFPDDFYKPLVAALEKRLGGAFPYIPVYYADVTNPPPSATAMATPTLSPQAAKFKEAFEKEMQKSFEAIPPSERTPEMSLLNLPGPISANSAIPKEIALYLFDANTSTQIQKRLTTALDTAMKDYDDIVFVSHSLGTLIAFDVLKQFGDRYNKISTWFTLGCPLLKLRRLLQRDANFGAIKYQNVARWFNVYDTSDFIADAIGPGFPRPGYRLHDIFVDVAGDPINAHDYPNSPETQELIAAAMRMQILSKQRNPE